MSNLAELHLLNRRVQELEETVGILDRAKERQEEKLRDKFAGMAMAAFLPDFWNDGTFARKAYEAADEMLKERAK